MKKHLLRTLAPALGLLAAAPAALRAQSIGGSYGDGTANTTLAATDRAGAPGFTQVNFNNLTTASASLLRDSSGLPTTVTAAVSSPNGPFVGAIVSSGATVAGPDERFINGEISGNLAPLTLTLTNIPYTSYSLAVYNAYGQNRTETATLGGTTFYGNFPNNITGAGYLDGDAATPFTYTQATGAASGTATAKADYALFTGLSGASQTVTLSEITQSGSVFGPNPYLSGFQIINTGPTVVPEPSPRALLGLGFIGALGVALRRRRAVLPG